MKKLCCMLALLCVFAGISSAQISLSVPNDTTTGTKQNKLAKYNTTASATSIILMATTDTTGAIGIVSSPDSAVGVGVLTISGVAPCIFDNATTPNDFVQISSTTAGDCHDTGSAVTRPTSGQIIGTVWGAGGAAGTYNVSLNKDIYPAAATAPVGSVSGSSDTLSAAGTFATTISVPATAISGVGQILEIRAHGVYTTNATASPVENIQVNAGGTTGICSHSTGNNNLATSVTNVPWDVACYIQIVTTGAPGTAYAWGLDEVSSGTLGGNGTNSPHFYVNASTVNYTTNSSQTVSIQETGTLVSGTSLTLQSLVVRNY
jgi:hypothetical protein